jgi:glycerophosphoryl diester phosphodiesterase
MQSILDAMYKNRTLVFGHRGASAYAPMNTIPAYELAAEQGADGIELDVHRSKDGYAVIVHDFTVDHTTDGSGRVDSMTLAELKALDAGSWFGESFKNTRIPTLDEVFEAVGRRLFVNVEIKSESLTTDGVEQVVADVIARHHMQQRVILSSFNPLTLQRFRAIMPDVPIGFLYAPDVPADIQGLMRQIGLPHEARHPYHAMIDSAYMAWAKSEGYRVNTWTVNDPARAVELRNLGVDGIITDKPDVILQALRDR